MTRKVIIMPVSSPLCKVKMINWILDNIPKYWGIMDVGPGEGTYYNILHPLGYSTMDCIEIYEPWIDRYKLRDKYGKVFLEDAIYFKHYDKYDFVILGDVLEHMTREDGQRLIAHLKEKVQAIIVSVPFANTQGPYQGNTYETHLQNDLNAETFTTHYPGFTLIADEEDKARHNDLGEWEHITAWVWTK